MSNKLKKRPYKTGTIPEQDKQAKARKVLGDTLDVGLMIGIVLIVVFGIALVSAAIYRNVNDGNDTTKKTNAGYTGFTGTSAVAKINGDKIEIDKASDWIHDDTVVFTEISDWSYGETVKFTCKGQKFELPNTDVIIIDYGETGYGGFNATEYHEASITLFDYDTVTEDIYHVEDVENCENSPAKRLYTVSKTYYLTEDMYEYQLIVHEDTTTNQTEITGGTTETIITGPDDMVVAVDNDNKTQTVIDSPDDVIITVE